MWHDMYHAPAFRRCLCFLKRSADNTTTVPLALLAVLRGRERNTRRGTGWVDTPPHATEYGSAGVQAHTPQSAARVRNISSHNLKFESQPN